ncbi:MAG: nucleotidyltransferase family protein [Clostridia bacterium]|nr:nucleotidyltransferase family protein [Clostridia bacterium]
MKNVGIICEYNPLHGGHKYMIETLRAMGAERIICLMSGNCVQRGDFAVIPKNRRALSAIEAGADAVFELPFPYSAGGAEFFATAGVDILNRLGVDTIAFGSETGNVEKLRKVAERSELFVPSANKSIGTAEDYFSALGKDYDPNDILGIEYLKAGKKLAPDLEFMTVKREGAGYHGEAEKGAYPSATEIRRAIADGELGKYSDIQLPPESRRAIEAAAAEGETAYLKNIESAILSFWRLCDVDAVSECAECGGGVAQRIMSAARASGDLEHMISVMATKRYTDSRLRRAVIFGMTGVKKWDLKERAAYVNLLAANEKGLAFVSDVKDIAVVSKPSKIPDSVRAIRQFTLGQHLESLYTLAMTSPRESGTFLRQSPTIVKIDQNINKSEEN